LRTRTWSIALVVILMSALAVIAGPAVPAGASTTTVTGTLNCVAHAPIIGDQNVTQSFTVVTNAPATVLPGHTFSVTAQTPADTIATSQSGGTVSSVTNVSYRIPVPANSAFVSASFAGGFNYGSGTPTVTQSGTDPIVFTVPGPIPAGQQYQLPAVTVTLTATGAAFSTISLQMGGTSTSDPGFTTTANVTSPISASVPTVCYPAPPNPVWSTTTIVPPDVTPPVVALDTPADGGQYPLGGSVAANYQCTDGQFGSGVATCTGDVADGAPIDTSTLGEHSFTVTASDNEGNVSAPVTHVYTVVPAGNDHTPPDITLTTPPDGAVYSQGAAVTASYSCVDNGSGVATCSGTTPNGGSVDTSTPGAHTYSVSASDGQGNSFTVLHSYRVNPPAAQQNWSTGDVTDRMPVGCDTLLNSFHESIPVASNTAPTSAAAGSQFTWSMAIDTDVIPTLNNATNLIYRWKKPTNGHFVSAAFTGPGSEVNGTAITINADGTLQVTVASVTDQSILGFGDDSFKPPPFSAVVQIDGAPGTVVQNEFDYFQLTTTTVGLVTTTQHCPAGDTYDNRTNVPLTNTAVVDGTPPAITISSPVNGQTYAPGSPLKFTYSCSDNVAATTCAGDAPSGTSLDTSTSGTHQLHVTSTDAAGNSAARYVTYSIADPTVSVSGDAVSEGPGATLNFPITLSNPSSYQVSVDYATSDGTATQPDDYANTAGTVTFAPGDPLTKVVSVPVTTAEYFVGSRDFTFALASAIHATVVNGTATGTINGIDPPTVAVANAAVTEGPGRNLDFAVSLAANPAYPVAVSYATNDGTATQPTRYTRTSGALEFDPGGSLVQHVLVPVVNDSVYNEGSAPTNTQTMSLTASEDVNGATSSGTGTITDDEVQPPILNIGSATLREGDTGKRAVKLTVTLNKPSTQTISVRYATVNGTATAGSDYKAKSGALTFRPKAVSASIAISVAGDTATEPDESFSVALSQPMNALLGNATGTVTILNDDGPSAAGVEATVSDVSLYEGGGGKTSKVSFVISINKPGGSVTLNYTTVPGTALAGSDYKAKSGAVTFKGSAVAKVITIAVTADNIVEGNETFDLKITGGSGATITDATGVATIIDDD